MNDMQLNFEFETNNDEKYKIDDISDNTVNARQSITGQLSALYYLIL